MPADVLGDFGSLRSGSNDLPQETVRPVRLPSVHIRTTEKEVRVLVVRAAPAPVEQSTCKFSKLAKITLPFVAGLIGLLISIASFVISNDTSKRQMELEERLKDREAFRSALDLAFGDKVNQSGHVAGIWALSEFWRNPGYEQQLATILASILSSGEQDEHMSRVAAAEVIGTAIKPEDIRSAKDKERVKRIAELLYGSHTSWSVGTVSFQNSSLRRACPFKNNDCADQLEQTRQAIRKNWEFLEDANLSHRNLRG